GRRQRKISEKTSRTPLSANLAIITLDPAHATAVGMPIQTRREKNVSGKLSLDELKAAVAAGEIDTVLVAHVDMQGRLMGKRFQAEFFLESGFDETHCCNYLLATDMEMNTVDGYKATSWEAGYGDYARKPDLSTLRRIPWLVGTALGLCDVLVHHTHAEVPHSPRAVLKRQIARLETM